MAKNNTFKTTAITLKMIIESGILKTNLKVVSVNNSNVEGILNADGSITLYFDGLIKNFPYPSGAARYVEKKSINGWLYWYVVIDGDKYNLSFLRDKYIHSVNHT